MKYALGLDYGSLSARALLVEVETGKEAADAVRAYRHGFIEDALPATGETLPPDWTLQDPQDYLSVLALLTRDVLSASGVAPEDIIGVGVDFTACTILPVKADGTPLCFLPEFRGEKHAYVKKWKHHAAQDEANRLNAVAARCGEQFLDWYGKRISSEWMVPKVWQVLNEAPGVYEAADHFIEAADWMIWQLTGVLGRCNCAAGYKAIWTKGEGYPPTSFFKALDERLEHVVEEKLSGDICFLGDKVGEVTGEMAAHTGLCVGTAVAAGIVDAHVAVPAMGISEPESFLLIIGTSTSDLLLGRERKLVPGICGAVEDGVLPGLVGFEAGQCCVGDMFDWFVRSQVPPAYHEQAAARGCSIHLVLRELAQALLPGENGLVALDWWGGNRSVLVDADVTGMIVGMTLATKPEEIYRALLEATAYGARKIIENFEQHGVAIKHVYACGGISIKDPFMMQIYADVFGREIATSAVVQTTAYGAAMYGAVAAGAVRGGYDDIGGAIRNMRCPRGKTYTPNPEAHAVYEELYAEFLRLHDYFGRGENDVMKRLKALRNQKKTHMKQGGNHA